MLSHIAHDRAQTYLRQRNFLALTSSLLAITAVVAGSFLATRPREIVLTPTISRPISVSSAGVSSEYLELVTRDTALMLLNRSPEGLDYWMQAILDLADPAAFGRLKAELMEIVTEQRGSDVTQSFVIRAMKVDPAALTSDVTGTLKTFVGAQVIASDERRFRFRWTYSGLHLALTGFAQLPATDKTKGDGQ
ncbi:MAG: type IV conjugative transfer system protein TraE [Novosphingobium sp.]